MASALNNRPFGKLLSDIQVPRQEDAKECKGVELRSGKELQEPYKAIESERKEEKEGQGMDKENEDGWVEVQKLVSQPTFANIFLEFHFHGGCKRVSKTINFKNIFKNKDGGKLSINIPFAETLEQMLSYEKFMKQILSKKK